MTKFPKRKEARAKRKVKRITIIIMTAVFLLLFATGAYVWHQIGNSYQPIDRINWNEDKKEEDKNILKEPISIVLYGLDAEGRDFVGRTDTIILMLLNPTDESVSLLSLPRDTYTEIVGENYKDKITHANNYGVETSIASVEKMLDMHIDYYAMIDLDGFKKVIDELGGIELEVEKRMRYSDPTQDLNIDLYPGLQTLNGEQAMGYARFRSDAEGDFGRIKRQQKLIKAVMDQSLSFRSATKFTDLVKIVGDHFKTDLTRTDMLKILNTYHAATGENLTSIPVEGVPFMLNGVSYVDVSSEERARLRQIIQNQLSDKSAMNDQENTDTENNVNNKE